LKACKELSDDGAFVNMTYCFSVTQAIIASKMGASFVSPYISGYDKKGFDGLKLAKDIKDTFNNYPELQTQIILNDIDKIFYIQF
jgi:transaldolase